MNRRLLVTGLLALTILWAAPGAVAEDYRFSRVAIEATVGPDGSMTVVEDRTVSFDGSFTRVWQDFPKSRRWEYSDFQVFENGVPYRAATPSDRDPVRTPATFHVDDVGGFLRVTWYYRAEDEARTFRITYRVAGAVTAYGDIAELYWKFIGDGWSVPTGRATIAVELPAPGAEHPDLRIWQHGPQGGEIRAESPTRVIGTTPRIPAHTFVELRIVFPPSLVPRAAGIPGPRLPTVLAEEEAFAAAANRARWLARGGLVLPPAGLAVFLLLFFRYGKEYTPEVGEYEHDLPAAYSPAVLGYLWRFRRTKPDDLTATLLDLARRGHLRIEQQPDPGRGRSRTVHVFIRGRDRPDGLNPYEEALLSWAFDEAGDGSRVTDAELAGRAKDASGDFASWFERWKRMVRSEAERQGFFERSGTVFAAVNLLAGIGFALAGLALTALGAVTGVAGIVWGALQVALSPVIRRRSWTGSTHYQRWKAFRRFLGDFSELERMPPAALPIWERYLVYAVPLGVADEVTRSMAQLSPAYEQATGRSLTPSWVGTSNRSGAADLGSLTSSMSSFTSAVSAAIAPLVVRLGRRRRLLRRRRGRGWRGWRGGRLGSLGYSSERTSPGQGLARAERLGGAPCSVGVPVCRAARVAPPSAGG